MTKSEYNQQQQQLNNKAKSSSSNNLNKIDLKLKNLDSYNNERLKLSSQTNLLNIQQSDFKQQIIPKTTTGSGSGGCSSGGGGGGGKVMLSSDSDSDNNGGNKAEPVKYGEFVVIGYNGYIPKGKDVHTDSSNRLENLLQNIKENHSRHRSKFELKKRSKANGVKPAGQKMCSNLKEVNEVMKDNNCHSITYTLSRNEAVIVKYTPDEKTDMFQIGRSSESSIDFIVLDTVLPSSKDSKDVKQSTISRFACRVIVDREAPYTARIYAAGFDQSKHIFLGEKATKWKNDKGELDGITTNGILIMHPLNDFSPESKCGDWVEVSVCGAIFRLNNTKPIPFASSSTQLSQANVLRDGTLIDLCGATLLWRSAEGLAKTTTLDYIAMYIERLENNKIICPINYLTLMIPPALPSSLEIEKKFENLSTWRSRIPMVSINCGHVQGCHDWGIQQNSTDRECALCRTIGPYVKLKIGIEPSFFCDIPNDPFKAYAFNPCGHMATEKTCKYWSEMRVPQGTTSDIVSVCPFCANPLSRKPYIKLIFEAARN